MHERVDQVLSEYSLTRFGRAAAQRVIQRMAVDEGGQYARVRLWFVSRLNGLPGCRPSNPWQRGCPQIVPSLRAAPFWDVKAFPWLQRLQAAIPAIREELLALRGIQNASASAGAASEGCSVAPAHFQPYRSPVWSADRTAPDGVGGLAHDRGEWNVFYLFLHNVSFDENCAQCPRTVELVRSVPGQYHHVFFSNLAPHTHIAKHHGPTNKKLRIHIPLFVPAGGCRLRVGDRVHTIREGEPYVFDDSFEHEAWNDSDQSRIVLILDVWHPDLSDAEVKFMHFLQQSSLRAERAAAQRAAQSASCHEESAAARDNLFAILDKTRAMPPAEEALWAGVDA